MALITTPENEFIEELSGYLDIDFNDFSVNKIKGFLQKYKDTLPIVQSKPVVITKERIVFREIKGRGFVKIQKGANAKFLLPIEVMNMVSQVMGVTLNNMVGRSQEREYVDARFIAQYLIRNICNETWKAIGQLFNRDHTSAIHAYNEVGSQIKARNEKYTYTIETVNNCIADMHQKKAS